MARPATPPLRVCFVWGRISTKPNAVTHAITDLARELQIRGHEPFFLVMRPVGKSASSEIPERWPSMAPKMDSSRSSRLIRRLWFLVAGLRWLLTHRSQYDVLVTAGTPPGIGLLGRLVRRCDPSKLHIMWVLDLFYSQAALLEPKPGWGLRILRALEIRSVTDSQHVVVLGRCMEAFLRRATRPANVRVIPIWPGPDLLRAPAAATPLAGRQLVYSGHAAARHPLTWLCSVNWRELGYRVRVQGDGTEIDKIGSMLGRTAYDHGVTVTGPIPRGDYLAEAQRATIHLVTLDARASGTCVPSKAYAAMALSRPVLFVGDTRGQAAADIRLAGAGLVIRDPIKESERLFNFLALSAEELDRMGASGRDFVLDNRTVVHAADAWLALMLEGLGPKVG